MRRQHGVELALADDDVLLAADPGVREQLLDVEQAARRAVDRVLALAGTEQRPRDRHLGEVDRQPVSRVVDDEGDLGSPERRPFRGAGEDDVVHLRRAHDARPLGAEHPGDGVDDVRLARAVRPHDDRDAGLEFERRRVGERLEALERERLQKHGAATLPGWRGRIGSAGHTISGRDRAPPVQPWQRGHQWVERPDEARLLDRRPTARAGLAGAAVDGVVGLETPRIAEEVAVAPVAERRAPRPTARERTARTATASRARSSAPRSPVDRSGRSPAAKQISSA